MPKPAVIVAPESTLQLKRGFDLLADLLALTLGPTQGIVLSGTDLKARPEVLSDAATIARRIVEVPDARQNVGVMLLRNMVWRVHQRVGDGGALTAVLAQALLKHTLRCMSAGANPILLARGVRRAVQAAVERLSELSQPPQGEDDLVAVAHSVTGQDQLSRLLGEMFDLLGSHAYITVEDYMAPYLERVYLDGGHWQAGVISPYLINSPALGRAVLKDCRVALYDGTVSAAEEVRSLLEQAGSAEEARLLFVAHQVSGEALNLLVATNQQTALKIIAVALKRVGDKARADLEDLALLSGARVISPILGRTLASISQADLGAARRAEASAEDLNVFGGVGDSAQARRQVDLLHRQLQRLPIGDEGRGELEMRLGRLSGSAGILKIGALTQAERDFLHQKAEQGLRVLRATLSEGVLPGGGVAYLRCIPAVDALWAVSDGDEAMGMRATARALEAPFCCILRNAGVDAPAVYLEQIRKAPLDHLYDALSRAILPARQAGVLDSTAVLRAALETAASGALMALSTDTLVLKRKPKVSYEP
jgi:chaperonin GroEL